MSDVKMVNVSLTPIDEKMLLGGSKSRRRTRRGTKSREEEDVMMGGGEEALNPPQTPAAVQQPIQIAKMDQEPISPLAPVPPTIPPQVVPALSTTTTVGGAGTVNIKPKVNATETVVAAAAPAVKILPTKKRITNVPSANATLKKPKLIVPVSAAPENGAARRSGGDSTQSGGGAGHLKKTRKFKQRTVSITVKPSKASRKFRRTIKRRVHTMPISAVKRLLIKKGIIKPKSDTALPPEDIMRSMLADYMMLHNSE